MPGQVIDTCCLINLYAAGDLNSLLSASGADCYVPRVVSQESLYIIRPGEEAEAEPVHEEIDLGPAIGAGLLTVCELETDAETRLYVEFAAEVDDGEAACLALAKARGWIIATDDRKAQRLAAEARIAVVTTPELIRRWAEAAQATSNEVANVLCRIRDSARFIPRKGSPLYEWWLNRLDQADR